LSALTPLKLNSLPLSSTLENLGEGLPPEFLTIPPLTTNSGW
jgi:hypothetical protein